MRSPLGAVNRIPIIGVSVLLLKNIIANLAQMDTDRRLNFTLFLTPVDKFFLYVKVRARYIPG